jgi:hypothetical protein
MRRKKGIALALMLGFFMIVSVMSVSAKWYEFGNKDNFLGKLFASKPVNVSVTMGNSPPQIIMIHDPGITSPRENDIAVVTIKVTAFDSNGMANIDGAPAQLFLNLTNPKNNLAIPSLTGDNLRVGYGCTPLAETTTFTVNWSCSVDMQYWDIGGSMNKWNITARIVDDTTTDSGTNTSNSADPKLAQFQYSTLAGMVTDRVLLTWSDVSATTTNQPADNPAINITNVGNVNISGVLADNKLITVTGYNLTGVSTSTNLFYSESFTADDASNCAAAGLEALNHSIAKNITGAKFERRPKSDPTSNATIYFCLKNVKPSPIPSDSYVANKSSPGNGGSWMIGLYAP